MAYTFKHGDRPLDGLTIQRAVGRGGFGEVYYALTDSGKQVAVKYLRDNPEVELRGIAHVMNLKSPHLITIYDVKRNENGEPFVMMEYVSGPSLRELLLASPGGLGPQKAAFFLSGIGKGLSYLHERGIVHRDLKPGNIFYDDGYVKIGDYGLSKHISVSAHSGNTVSVGTVHYMAPEIGSGSYSKAIDIYALGAMLYEMITGRLPFTGSSMGEVLMRHMNDRPDIAGVAEPFRSVIVKALQKNPADRYQDVNEMIDAVLASTEVSESMSSFDPSVFSAVPRDDQAADRDRTRTTPPRIPLIELDARGGFPEIPPIPPLIETVGGSPVRPLQPKPAGREPTPPVPAPASVMDEGPPRWPQVMVILMSTTAVAAILGMTQRREEAEVAFGAGFLLLGAAIGLLFAHLALVKRTLTQHPFIERIVYAMSAFAVMLPGTAILFEADDDLGRLVIPVLATLLLFDWKERIEDGRRRMVDGGSAFYHAVVGLIVGAIARTESPWYAAAICGALPMITQLAAAILPACPRSEKQADAAPKGSGAAKRTFDKAAKAVERAGGVFHAEIGWRHPKEGSPAPTPPPPPPAPAAAPATPRAAELDEPSFVGRTANVGLSILAKILLLASFALALLYNAEIPEIRDGDGVFRYNPGQVIVGEGDRVARVDVTRARPLLLAPILLGMVLLLVARRFDGAAHFLRGVFSAVFLVGAVIMTVGPANEGFRFFLGANWSDLDPGEHLGPMLSAGFLFAGALTLLFWPKARPPREIVL